MAKFQGLRAGFVVVDVVSNLQELYIHGMIDESDSYLQSISSMIICLILHYLVRTASAA